MGIGAVQECEAVPRTECAQVPQQKCPGGETQQSLLTLASSSISTSIFVSPFSFFLFFLFFTLPPTCLHSCSVLLFVSGKINQTILDQSHNQHVAMFIIQFQFASNQSHSSSSQTQVVIPKM